MGHVTHMNDMMIRSQRVRGFTHKRDTSTHKRDIFTHKRVIITHKKRRIKRVSDSMMILFRRVRGIQINLSMTHTFCLSLFVSLFLALSLSLFWTHKHMRLSLRTKNLPGIQRVSNMSTGNQRISTPAYSLMVLI